jgi:hypothetical protein
VQDADFFLLTALRVRELPAAAGEGEQGGQGQGQARAIDTGGGEGGRGACRVANLALGARCRYTVHGERMGGGAPHASRLGAMGKPGTRRSFISTQRSPLDPSAMHVVGRISWLRRVCPENPLSHVNFLSGLTLSGECDGGLGPARFSAVCPSDGHMHANGLLWHRPNYVKLSRAPAVQLFSMFIGHYAALPPVRSDPYWSHSHAIAASIRLALSLALTHTLQHTLLATQTSTVATTTCLDHLHSHT